MTSVSSKVRGGYFTMYIETLLDYRFTEYPCTPPIFSQTVEGLYYTLSTTVSFPLLRTGTAHAPSPAIVPPPPEPKGRGQHSLVGEGVGGPNSDNWRKSLAFCLHTVWHTSGNFLKRLALVYGRLIFSCPIQHSMQREILIWSTNHT